MNEVIGIVFCLFYFPLAVSSESWFDEWSEQMRKDVSHDTYLNLLLLQENKSSKMNLNTLESFEKIFKDFDTDFVRTRSRRDANAASSTTTTESPFDDHDHPEVHFYKWEDWNHWYSDWPTMYICLTQVDLARAGIAGLRKYYDIRTLYTYDYEYELGYLVSEIIHHYTSLLEIMNMVHSRYVKFRFRRVTTIENEADLTPVRYMWYLYRQMVDLTKKIIILCEMLYSLKEKHRNNIMEKGLLSPFVLYPLDKEENVTFRELLNLTLIKQKEELMRWKGKKGYRPGMAGLYPRPKHPETSEERARRKKKLIKKAIKDRASGLATKVPIKKSKKNYHHYFHYGWSIEESWLQRPSKGLITDLALFAYYAVVAPILDYIPFI